MPPIRILLIDDDDRFHETIQALTADNDELSLLARGLNGEQAVQLCKEFHPDIILIEVTLPGISGIEATKAIREHYPHGAVLAVSSSLRKNTVRAMLDAGASGYISKTSRMDDLEFFLRAAFGGKVVLSTEVARLLYPVK